MRIRKLDLYVLRELFLPLLAGTLVLAILFEGNEFIALYKYQISQMPPLAIVQLAVVKLPGWLTFCLPGGLAFAVSLVVSRLVRESELTAMRSAGIPIRRVLVAVLVVGVAFSGASMLLLERIVPVASKKFMKLSQEFAIVAANPKFESNVMIKLSPYTARFGSVERTSDRKLSLKDVLLVEEPAPKRLWITMADTGTYDDGVWTLTGARFFALEDTSLVSFKVLKEFKVNQKIEVPDLFSASLPTDETVEMLWQQVQEERRLGRSSRKQEVQFYAKFANAASCFFIALVSAVASVRVARYGAFAGVFVSLVMAAVYINMFIVATEIIGQHGWLAPMPAAWLADVILGLFGVTLAARME
ncbi:MAG: LptF/LptG family permease [Armatimonadetes bacterium]|nr:LptF/LptG family permease [Armatimonadota bacterium]